MPVIVGLWQRVYVAIATLSWTVLGVCFLAHALLSYALFLTAGEVKLTDSAITFAYFYMTTATTVGYGDLSPGSEAGRLANVLVVLPGSIALFTVFLGKAVSSISGFWRRRLQGHGDFSERSGHTLVVGWQGMRSRRLIEGLLRDGQQQAQHPIGQDPRLSRPGRRHHPGRVGRVGGLALLVRGHRSTRHGRHQALHSPRRARWS